MPAAGFWERSLAETGNPQFLRPLAAPGADQGQACTFTAPLRLDSGHTLDNVTLAYMTYGKLNAARSNAVLVCHALSLDQFAASASPLTGKPGWWDVLIGPGKPDRHQPLLRHLRQCASAAAWARPARPRSIPRRACPMA